MLTGRFGNTTGRPYIEARLLLPRFPALQADLSLLVDTGADQSCLMPADGVLLGLDYSRLTAAQGSSIGAGGSFATFTEPAWLVFGDGTSLYAYSIALRIVPFSNSMLTVPSLLGRDVLRRWKMSYDPSNLSLEFDVVSADVIVPQGAEPTIDPFTQHD